MPRSAIQHVNVDHVTNLEDLGALLAELVVQEVRLAKAEVSEKIAQVQRGVVSLAAGGAIAFAGFLALLAAAVLGLAYLMPYWMAALAVGLVTAAIGGMMIATGRRDLKKDNLILKQTKQTLREDKQWAKAQMTQPR